MPNAVLFNAVYLIARRKLWLMLLKLQYAIYVIFIGALNVVYFPIKVRVGECIIALVDFALLTNFSFQGEKKAKTLLRIEFAI